MYVRSSPVYIQLPLFDRQERRVSNDYYYVPTKWNPVTEEIEENNEVESNRKKLLWIHILNWFLVPFELIDNGGDDDSDYIRFPTFPEQYNIPYDNLQLQQTYNVDNGPMVDDMNEYIDVIYIDFKYHSYRLYSFIFCFRSMMMIQFEIISNTKELQFQSSFSK